LKVQAGGRQCGEEFAGRATRIRPQGVADEGRLPGALEINVLRRLLLLWCTCVMRSKVEAVEAMKEVAATIRDHIEGIVAWAQTSQTNGFLEAINGLFQAAKRRARGYGRFDTIKTVIFLIADKLDFQAINPHARQPT
jgi:hypothetical protein